ncbi:unnamed protein product [Cylicostephanus goldi]|uniref:Uncharacterized protein n=1 Tax=Cylicostephanus goldi TaxID=71465 RepID=A0A3P7MH92_CYLGO|nr:unnamed protein product [Cylicostephanus goldi]
MPLNSFPWVLNGLGEALVPLRRLRRLFNLNNMDVHDIYALSGDKDAVIYVREGNFEEDQGMPSAESRSVKQRLLGETKSLTECIGITQESVSDGIGYMGEERWLYGAGYVEFFNLFTFGTNDISTVRENIMAFLENKERRRHVIPHIREMRLRCSLCGAGSFFFTVLRVHLMEGYCEKLHRAPEVVDLDRHPCMTKEQADSLSELVHPINPGRVMYTSGHTASAKSRVPYCPDPVIEERILELVEFSAAQLQHAPEDLNCVRL